MSTATESMRAVVAGATELVHAHLALFKAELSRDARRYGAAAGTIAVLLPLILVGWGFLCVALALFLQRMMAVDLAFLAVGGLNLLIASVGIVVAVKRLQARPAVLEAVEALERTREVLLDRPRLPKEPAHG